jgi:hypothetical protein
MHASDKKQQHIYSLHEKYTPSITCKMAERVTMCMMHQNIELLWLEIVPIRDSIAVVMKSFIFCNILP